MIPEDKFSILSELLGTRSTKQVSKQVGRAQEGGSIQEGGSTGGSTIPSLGVITQFLATNQGEGHGSKGY